MNNLRKPQQNIGERGSSGVKLLITGLILFMIGFAGYNYIPVAFQAQSFKEDLESAMIKAITMPKKFGKPKELVKKNIERAIRENDIPSDAFIDVKSDGQNVSARVYYSQEVPILPLNIYNFEYVFDETVTPNGLMR